MNRKKWKALLLTAAAAVAMSTAAVPAMASADNANDPKGAYLVKYLMQPEGTSDRGYSFVFDVEPVYDSSAAIGDVSDMPDAFTCTLTPDTVISTVSTTDDDSYAKASIADVFAGKTFDHTGLYVYLVTEQADTNTLYANDDEDGAYGLMQYSTAAYQLNLFVSYDSETGTYAITRVGVADLSDNANGTQEENIAALKEGELDRGVKVDPQILPDEDAGEDDDGPYNRYDGFQFVNIYAEYTDGTQNTDDSDKEQALYLEKMVSSVLGPDTTTGFTFTMQLTLPDAYMAAAGVTELTAYIYDADGTRASEEAVVFTNETEQVLTLTHGQYLGFETVPVGTWYTVTENLSSLNIADRYTASYTINDGDAVTAPAGLDLTIAETITDYTSERISYTNTLTDPAATGLSDTVLPFGVLAAAAAAGAGLIGFESRRRRRRALR